MPNFFPLSPTQLIDYYSTYIKGAIKYMVELNYDQTDIDAMSALLSALESSHTGHLAAKTALKEAVELRDGKVKLVAADVMKRSRIIQASELDNVVLKAMGLPIHDKIPSHEVPFIITHLEVTGLPEKANELDWDKNGNKSGTQYIIEARLASEPDFHVVDTVTATKYLHKNQTPGVTVYYRITSRRGKLTSLPCTPVAVYL